MYNKFYSIPVACLKYMLSPLINYFEKGNDSWYCIESCSCIPVIQLQECDRDMQGDRARENYQCTNQMGFD